MTALPTLDRAAILTALGVLFEPDDVIELRALHKGRKRTDAGYFDSAHWADLADHAARLSALGASVYVTLNPVDPQLLGRYHNRVQGCADTTTTDTQILRRRWLLIDLDPVRPAKTSATDAQLEAARVKARAICAWLKKQGWPAPVIALSGNGFHLLYAIDLPNDDAATALVKGALLALATRFDDVHIKVDRSVFNAARICKIYGTVACKGDNTAKAPWRLSKLLKTPPRMLVAQAQLSALAPVLEPAVNAAHTPAAQSFSLEAFLSRHGIEHTVDVHENSERFKLAACPFNSEHGHGQAAIFRQPTGALGFKCQHDSCSSKSWADVRTLLDGPPRERAPAAVKPLADDDQPGDRVTLLTTERGVLVACEHNARVLMFRAARYADLYFDTFLSRMRIGDRDWSDADDLAAVCWLQSENDAPRFTLAHTRNAARSLAYTRQRDTLREFVEALPVWDGVPRIKTAFHDAWGAPDNALMQAASSNFFIAMIARAIQPGAQVDSLWTFEGPQGSLKSKALRVLGGAFHAEVSAGVGTTDFQRELRGLWLAELSELDSLRGREASTVKRLLSAPADRFVQKYALHAESYPRRAISVATTNEAAYWRDPTGARRLIPIKCGEIRPDLIAARRLQWLAEARQLQADGATWWEFPDSIRAEQEARQCVDSWEDAIANHLTTPACKDSFDKDGRVPSAIVLRDWLGLEPSRQGGMTGPRLGTVMRRLGFKPVQYGTNRIRGWQRTDTDARNQIEVF
ncbi:VapE domain-containing protein [Polaromonas sp.]|uniref:VapE domain-containing protein n=1 Tax=Polaromonas sp. TaxID=1869339 RepID=UPI0017B94630|nr:VapE domain-containing protein [Polaromonas sp.]NMM07413.1 hypothetical protein [Polaromonas sp.]